uniref:Uncharacterized protein n=1 Tax=Oryza nivara TaxID=4536 RepID=A0A0E0GAD7_ORYNI
MSHPDLGSGSTSLAFASGCSCGCDGGDELGCDDSEASGLWILMLSMRPSTCIIRGSERYMLRLLGFLCTSRSICMKSGCSRYARVVGSEAILAEVGGSEAGVPLSPVGLQLDGLLGVGERLGVAVDRGERGGAVGVEDVVTRGERDGVSEVPRRLLRPAEKAALPFAFASSAMARGGDQIGGAGSGSFWKGSGGGAGGEGGGEEKRRAAVAVAAQDDEAAAAPPVHLTPHASAPQATLLAWRHGAAPTSVLPLNHLGVP